RPGVTAWPGPALSPRKGSQALLDIIAVLLEMLLGQSLQQAALDCVQVTSAQKVVGQRVDLLEGPGLKGGDELALVDQTDLRRRHPEEQVARLVNWTRHIRQLPGFSLTRTKWRQEEKMVSENIQNI